MRKRNGVRHSLLHGGKEERRRGSLYSRLEGRRSFRWAVLPVGKGSTVITHLVVRKKEKRIVPRLGDRQSDLEPRRETSKNVRECQGGRVMSQPRTSEGRKEGQKNRLEPYSTSRIWGD